MSLIVPATHVALSGTRKAALVSRAAFSFFIYQIFFIIIYFTPAAHTEQFPGRKPSWNVPLSANGHLAQALKIILQTKDPSPEQISV